MSKKTLAVGFVSVVALAVLVVGVRTAYAHCGKCLTDATYFAGALDKSKLTLAAASTVAEVATKGSAVHATVLRTDAGAIVSWATTSRPCWSTDSRAKCSKRARSRTSNRTPHSAAAMPRRGRFLWRNWLAITITACCR